MKALGNKLPQDLLADAVVKPGQFQANCALFFNCTFVVCLATCLYRFTYPMLFYAIGSHAPQHASIAN